MSDPISRAGQWFLRSGIQEANGGVARFYRADLGRNRAISTEITGYAASALAYLYALTDDRAYRDAALRAAHFLARAWDGERNTLPFELDPPARSYFFDSGIVVRGLLAVWRAAGDAEALDTAVRVGESMAADFVSPEGCIHPILALPDKRPEPCDDLRWSASPGCYQLKPAMAWRDLAEIAGERRFRELYERALDLSLRSYPAFLPGHPDRLKVMDRLHAFLYFLEGLLPCASEDRCAAALRDGIGRAAAFLRDIAPQFARSDVYAQLLRVRVYASWAGVTPIDETCARHEAAQLAAFQASSENPRIDGGFYFGRMDQTPLPHINPVSAAFALQALSVWERRGGPPQPLHQLI